MIVSVGGCWSTPSACDDREDFERQGCYVEFRCAIEQLTEWYPHLFLDAHIVASVGVMARFSGRPARFEVQCTDIEPLSLASVDLTVDWAEGTLDRAERLRATIQSRPLLEMASTALALVVVHRLVDLGRVDVTAFGDRADFRSLEKRSVLEISGMETAADSQIRRRRREKVAQALANPFGWSAYVVVCAFSVERHRICLSYHRAKE